jgi:TRAP-type mannitol/chloroaromatic compound transport system substrate-binding protein
VRNAPDVENVSKLARRGLLIFMRDDRGQTVSSVGVTVSAMKGGDVYQAVEKNISGLCTDEYIKRR